jgi:hypothetical protein
VRLEIPQASYSLNDFVGKSWVVKHRAKTQWALLMQRAGVKCITKATGARRVTVTRYSRGTLDHDNFVGGCKSIVFDNLVAFGLLIDDSPKWLRADYVQLPRGKGTARTVIEIEEM